jgi:tetrahydromethanopterin S-methyltransferase subunit G
VSVGDRPVAGAWSSASAVAATMLAVLGPDALGGTGPVERPVFGLDLLEGSAVGQVGALLIVLMAVWTLAQAGSAAHRASVVAAALSATLAQPLLDRVDEPVTAASAELSPAAGWLSGVAIALVYGVIAIGLLLCMDAIRSALGWLARTVIRSVHLLATFFARSAPTSPLGARPAPTRSPPATPTSVRCITRRGPPSSVVLASS